MIIFNKGFKKKKKTYLWKKNSSETSGIVRIRFGRGPEIIFFQVIYINIVKLYKYVRKKKKKCTFKNGLHCLVVFNQVKIKTKLFSF